MTQRRAGNGDRRPTLADVAAAAGVSPALVSIVIRDVPGASDVTRRRVLAIADDLGYRPDQHARMLRRQRTRLLGVSFEVQQPFQGDLVETIYAAAEALGYEVVLSAVAPSRDEIRAVQTLLNDRCEALILLGPRAPAAVLARWAGQIPVVVVARNIRDPSVDTVRSDDGTGLTLAVDLLIGLGHRRIVHVDGGHAASAPERRRGFSAAMRRHGLDGPARIVAGGPTEEDGAAAIARLLDANPSRRGRSGPAGDAAGPPTGIIAFNDQCALGVLDTLQRYGFRVPTDVSVVGYDDSRLASLSYVDLTTVGQDTAVLADLAVARAVARLEGAAVTTRQQVTAPRLMVRSTSGPAPA